MAGTGLDATTTPGWPFLPHVVENLVQDYPEQVFLTIPKSPDLKAGWRGVTYRDLGEAVNGLTQWLTDKLDESGHDGKPVGNGVVAYMGLNDLRYLAVLVSLMKLGKKTLFLSPRNSNEGQAHLIRETNCLTLLSSEGMDTAVNVVRSFSPDLEMLQVPTLDKLQRVGRKSKPIPSPLPKTEDDITLILHSSGSTGLPKPVYTNFGYLRMIGRIGCLPTPPGRRMVEELVLTYQKPMFTMFPFFHVFGLIMLINTLAHRSPLVTLPPERPPNPELILEVLRQTKPSAAALAPSMVELMCNTPGGLEGLGELEHVLFGGAPLARAVGDEVAKKTRVVSVIGATETGYMPTLLPEDPTDWAYHEFAPGLGTVLQPEGDGLYESVIKSDESTHGLGVRFTFPSGKPNPPEYHTKDLFEQHSTKAGLWRYMGRKDDVIVLSNGEKVNPVDFEKSIESHPLVRGALVVGQGRFQTGLLIEPVRFEAKSEIVPESIIDDIWPTIEKANALMPTHGRVWKSKVVLARPYRRPFTRAPKGSIVRRATEEEYGREITAMYWNEVSHDRLGKIDAAADMDTIRAVLRNAIAHKAMRFPESAGDDADIFSYGTDSLEVLGLSATLNHAIKTEARSVISPRDIYAHPTINRLAKFLHANANGAEPSREDRMAAMAATYTRGMFTVPLCGRSVVALQTDQYHTVLLTGSTGSLGTYILQELIAAPNVTEVCCLNRSADAEIRQRQAFTDSGFKADFSKVRFFHAAIGDSQFGLSEDGYGHMLACVDLIIHNAWPVDFNKSLESFGEAVASVRRMVDFSVQSRNHAHITFISSIASVGNWSAKHDAEKTVPERWVAANSVPLLQGYGESKHVAGQILSYAAEHAGVSSTIIRAGQLAGPSDGRREWNRKEWLPSLIVTSKALGMLPAELGSQEVVDWVPVDLAAKAVWEIAGSGTRNGEVDVAHLVNPRTSTWSELVVSTRDAIQQDGVTMLRLVPFSRWIDELKEVPLTEDRVARMPAVKLIDFYESLLRGGDSLPRLDMEETVKRSETLKNLEPIDGALMHQWLSAWFNLPG